MRRLLVLVALVSAAGCHRAAPAEAPRAATRAPPTAGATRPSPVMAVHPDRVVAREVLTAMRGFADEACEENAAADAVQARMQTCLAKHMPPVMPLTGTLILSQLRTFKDEICACADQPCLVEVRQRMLAWAMANLDAMKGVDPTDEEDAEADRLDAELAACTQRIDGAAH